MGNPFLASITAHEIFHAWNVKRLRPADLWPYQYDRPEPTPLVVGQRGHHGLLRQPGAASRMRIIESGQFFELTNDKVGEVTSVPPIALEDAFAVYLDSSQGRHRHDLLSQGLAGRIAARYPDPCGTC